MSSGGRGSFLDSIPGFGGYRDRERRRESDRLVRDRLARDFGEISDRLGRLASRLAADRKLAVIRHVDQPKQRLDHFISRLRTATYGYAGLFSDRPVEADALDQIEAFDRSLADQLDALGSAVSELESISPDDPSFRDRSDVLQEIVEGLHARFDRRSEVIEAGQPLPAESVTALLQAPSATARPPTAYNLHDSDAITFRGVNYQVVGRITAETPTGAWRDFQLQGGNGSNWLRVPASRSGRFYWLTTVTPEGNAGDSQVSVNGVEYQLGGTTTASAEVIGQGGSSDGRETTVYSYNRSSGPGTLCVYHWRADDLALAGEEIDPVEIELWSREGGQAV